MTSPFNNALAVETYLAIGASQGGLVREYTQGEHGRGAYYRIKEFEAAGLVRLVKDGHGKRVMMTVAGYTVLEHLRIVAKLSESPSEPVPAPAPRIVRQATLEAVE